MIYITGIERAQLRRLWKLRPERSWKNRSHQTIWSECGLVEPLFYPEWPLARIVFMIFTTVSYRSVVTAIWLSVPMIVTSSCDQ